MSALQLLLERSHGKELEEGGLIIDELENTKNDYKVCQRILIAPRRFVFSVAIARLRFGGWVQVDMMFFKAHPVIYMVDKATHLCAASFLRNQSRKKFETNTAHMFAGLPLTNRLLGRLSRYSVYLEGNGRVIKSTRSTARRGTHRNTWHNWDRRIISLSAEGCERAKKTRVR